MYNSDIVNLILTSDVQLPKFNFGCSTPEVNLWLLDVQLPKLIYGLLAEDEGALGGVWKRDGSC